MGFRAEPPSWVCTVYGFWTRRERERERETMREERVKQDKKKREK